MTKKNEKAMEVTIRELQRELSAAREKLEVLECILEKGQHVPTSSKIKYAFKNQERLFDATKALEWLRWLVLSESDTHIGFLDQMFVFEDRSDGLKIVGAGRTALEAILDCHEKYQIHHRHKPWPSS